MKSKTQIVLAGSVIALSLLAAIPVFAAALNWTTNENYSITNGTITVLSGSGATTLTVNAGNIIALIPVSTLFKVSSTKDISFTTPAAMTAVDTCTSGTEEVDITASAGATETITFTLGVSACADEISSGGHNVPTIDIDRAHPAGTLVLENGQTVFLMSNDGRLGFRDEQEYLSNGYNFNQVVPESPKDNATVFAGIQKAMTGTLVLDLSDGRTVYMIGDNYTKRGFTSEAVFAGLGYNFNKLFRINLSDYASGVPVSDATKPHPNGALVMDGQTIWWIRNNQKVGFESMQVFNTYGFTLDRVVPANDADRALREGSTIKFRDGTLVLDNGKYYIISEGEKKKFDSVQDMTSFGYKTSNAISASLDNY